MNTPEQRDSNLNADRRDALAAQPARRALSAPGDEPLTTPQTLNIDQTFRFDRGLSKRLRMRELNAKEAFTIRDDSGTFYRASLKEFNAKGGIART